MSPKDEKFGPEMASTPVGQYYLLDKIAQGGMAEIFKGLAYDLHGIKRTVVIKKILPNISADPEFINMLINEAKIAVMLSHGNIAQIYDLGKVGDDYFMVMEFVDGKSLSQIHKASLKKGNLLPVEYVCYFISEVANGLNYMHRRTDERGRNLGIIHRDISPQNVIVSFSGTVKIIDFGIAKAAIQINITESGVLKGKFAYMSPEQAKGEPIDQRSDIFSLGVILHELLTGRRLFKGKDKKETLRNVRMAKVPRPTTMRADLPLEIDNIALKALAADPRKRYMWASELRDDLIKFLYTNYPNFHPGTINNYICNLFNDEIAEREEMEEDAKTPFLIIDHTQSAIMSEKLEETGVTKVPPQLLEFMLEEETPHEKIKPAGATEEKSAKNKAMPAKIKFNLKNSLKNNWKILLGLFSASLIVLSTLFFYAIYTGKMEMPAFLKRFAPKTKLIIIVNPPDVQVNLGGEELSGSSPFRIKGIKPGENYRLIIEKDDYLPYARTVTLKESERKKINVQLKPQLPHFAQLYITSNPSGARIFFNEKDANLKTPAKLENILPNKYHTIGLFLEEHSFWSRDINLKPDEKKTIEANLEVDFGTLEIISNPAGADVFINGIPVGKTPFKRSNIKPNQIMDVTVSMTGFVSRSEKVQIRGGQTLTLRPVLSRTKEFLTPHFLRDIKRPD